MLLRRFFLPLERNYAVSTSSAFLEGPRESKARISVPSGEVPIVSVHKRRLHRFPVFQNCIRHIFPASQRKVEISVAFFTKVPSIPTTSMEIGWKYARTTAMARAPVDILRPWLTRRNKSTERSVVRHPYEGDFADILSISLTSSLHKRQR